MICCQGNCLDFVSLAICLLGSDYMLCDNMISSVENGDDHSTFNSVIFSSVRARQDQTTSHSSAQSSCFFTQKIPSVGSSNSWSLVQWDCLIQAGTRHLLQLSPSILPFPLPIPSVPYYISPPLPFSLDTPPFPHTPFLQNLSLFLRYSTCGLLGR